jgi:hypothetical protein
MQSKKTYTNPALTRLGTVSQITQFTSNQAVTDNIGAGMLPMTS